MLVYCRILDVDCIAYKSQHWNHFKVQQKLLYTTVMCLGRYKTYTLLRSAFCFIVFCSIVYPEGGPQLLPSAQGITFLLQDKRIFLQMPNMSHFRTVFSPEMILPILGFYNPQ